MKFKSGFARRGIPLSVMYLLFPSSLKRWWWIGYPNTERIEHRRRLRDARGVIHQSFASIRISNSLDMGSERGGDAEAHIWRFLGIHQLRNSSLSVYRMYQWKHFLCSRKNVLTEKCLLSSDKLREVLHSITGAPPRQAEMDRVCR